MIDPELSRLPYRRPPMTRGVDPQRINWLWRLICELAKVEPVEVVEALHSAGVPVDTSRARSWVVSDQEASFFPLTLPELERNVRSLIALRHAIEEQAAAAAEPTGQEPVDGASDAGDAEAGAASEDEPPLEW